MLVVFTIDSRSGLDAHIMSGKKNLAGYLEDKAKEKEEDPGEDTRVLDQFDCKKCIEPGEEEVLKLLYMMTQVPDPDKGTIGNILPAILLQAYIAGATSKHRSEILSAIAADKR